MEKAEEALLTTVLKGVGSKAFWSPYIWKKLGESVLYWNVDRKNACYNENAWIGGTGTSGKPDRTADNTQKVGLYRDGLWSLL